MAGELGVEQAVGNPTAWVEPELYHTAWLTADLSTSGVIGECPRAEIASWVKASSTRLVQRLEAAYWKGSSAAALAPGGLNRFRRHDGYSCDFH